MAKELTEDELDMVSGGTGPATEKPEEIKIKLPGESSHLTKTPTPVMPEITSKNYTTSPISIETKYKKIK